MVLEASLAAGDGTLEQGKTFGTHRAHTDSALYSIGSLLAQILLQIVRELRRSSSLALRTGEV